VLLGIINLYAASFKSEDIGIFDFKAEHGKQIMWAGLSLFAGFIAVLINGEIYRKYAYWIFAATMLLMVLVLFTKPINGARSWFGFGSIGIQPSEFGKLGIAIVTAASLSSMTGKVQDLKYVLRSNGLLLIPMVLVLLQPDAGTFLVYTSILLVFYREGMAYDVLVRFLINKFIPGVTIRRPLHFINNFIPILLYVVIISISTLLLISSSVGIPFTDFELPGYFGVIFSLLFIVIIFYFIVRRIAAKRARKSIVTVLLVSFLFSTLLVVGVQYGFNKLASHQKIRIELFLGLTEDQDGEDYNRNRAMSAVGSGKFSGKGYREATIASPKHKHVPMQSTDFIFSTWAEEWGFVGSSIVVLLFTTLVIRLVYVAERQRAQFSRVFIYCVACIFFFHLLINVGMVIGLAPVIGIPLPFFSYGGSSLVMFTILLFIAVRLDSERKEVLR
jgi:rod shape determining protein RodA